MRCKNCLGYGHTSKICNHASRCLHCGKVGHTYENCINKTEADIRCANCGGGHTATDKQSQEFIRARDARKKTVAGQGRTYSQALAADTNTTSTGRPPGAAAVNMDELKLELKLELKSTLSEFTEEFTSDITRIITEYGKEIHKLKVAHTTQMESQNQKIIKLEETAKAQEAKLNSLETTVQMLKINFETNKLQVEERIYAMIRFAVDSHCFCLSDEKGSASLERLYTRCKNLNAFLGAERISELSPRYWKTIDPAQSNLIIERENSEDKQITPPQA
jgi:hypothetical protein